jgi:MFS transporter, DHA2 family, glioxin efflux transporter
MRFSLALLSSTSPLPVAKASQPDDREGRIMTSTQTVDDGKMPEHEHHPVLLDPKSDPDSTYSLSTALDTADKPEPTGSTTLEDDERQEKLNPDDATPDEYPSGSRLVFIVFALVLSIFLVSLDLTIVATAVPKITDEFHGLDDVSWYSAAFFMTIGGFQSAWGKAFKYFPLKTSFLVSIFIFELGSLICGVAPSSTALIVGRAIAGLGAAGIGSGTYTIIAFSAGPKRRPMFTGIIGTSYGIAAVVGPLIGGVLADKVTWRWCFYINLPMGAIAAFIILLFFKTPSAAQPKSASLREKLLQMDPVGVTLVMGAVICYILALHYGGLTYAWNSSQVVGLLVGFVALLAAFTTWEWCQEDRAMVPFRLAGNRVYLVSSVFSFFFSGAYFLIIYYLPIYFQSIGNVSPEMSGVRNLPLILTVTISMLASGAYISITGIVSPIIVIGAGIGTVCTGLLYTLNIGSGEREWIGYQIVGGVGWGIASQIPIITVQATATAADLAEVTAILLFFQTVGGSFMVSAAQAAFVNVLIEVLPHSAPGVDPLTVVKTGVTDLRTAFSADQVPGILVAYMRGLKISFAIGLASSGVAFIVITLFQRWNRINTTAIAGGPAA